jgi:hypothetical protein
MSSLQKLLVAVLPKHWSKEVEQSSRSWVTHCSCGCEISVWDQGGVRLGALSSRRQKTNCPRCGLNASLRTYRKRFAISIPQVLHG